MYAAALLASLVLRYDHDAHAEHRRELAHLSCAALDSLLVRQSVFVVRLMDKFERTCRTGVARDVSDPVCRGISTAIIQNREDADDVEAVLWNKCGGPDGP